MNPHTFIMSVILPLQTAALFIALLRLAIGPSLPDRFVAFDLISIISIGVIAVYAVAFHSPFLLDAAMILSLVVFLSTAALAFYIRRESDNDNKTID
jgi:multicomponent Na+:H+ antiporter subunit F